MDKRKLALVLALGGSIAIGSLFMGDDDPIRGSYRGGYYAQSGSYGSGGGSPAEWCTMTVAVSPDTAYCDAESLAAFGGPYDQIIDSDNAYGEFLRGCINMGSADQQSQHTTSDRVIVYDDNYWGSNQDLVMLHFPLGDLAGFDAATCEVISATYMAFWRASGEVLSAGDTIFAVGCDRADMLWSAGGDTSCSRNYMEVATTTAWPERESSTDPNDWLGLEAISTLTPTVHDFVTGLTTVANDTVTFDMTTWAQGASGPSGVNGGIWHVGNGHGGADYNFLLNGMTSTDSYAKRPRLIMQYRYQRPAVEGVDFAVFSDNHSNAYSVGLMGAAMDAAGFDPEFLVHCGDMNLGDQCAEADTSLAQQDTLGFWWEEIPIALVTGNHDNGATCSNIVEQVIPTANMAFEDSITARGGTFTPGLVEDQQGQEYNTYSWEIGGVHFTSISLFEYGESSTITDKDKAWFEDDLAGTTAPVKIVFIHFPTLDSDDDCDYPEDEASAPWQDMSWETVFKPIWEAHGVTAVFAGHRHFAYYGVEEGILYVDLPSSNNDDAGAHQGFATVRIAPTGDGRINLYRGRNSTGYDFTRTIRF